MGGNSLCNLIAIRNESCVKKEWLSGHISYFLLDCKENITLGHFTKILHKFLSVLSVIGGKGIPVHREVWESEYQTGHWKYLHNISQLAHYSIIVGYF